MEKIIKIYTINSKGTTKIRKYRDAIDIPKMETK